MLQENMMSINFRDYLGMHFGQPELCRLFDVFVIQAKPTLVKDDDTAHISNPSIGVELTFRDAAIIDDTDIDLPDGALVLTNVRFYGTVSGRFKPYQGKLPDDTQFGDTLENFVAKFGEPDWKNPTLGKFRWETEKTALLA